MKRIACLVTSSEKAKHNMGEIGDQTLNPTIGCQKNRSFLFLFDPADFYNQTVHEHAAKMFTGRYKDDIFAACEKISKSYSPKEIFIVLERLGYGGPLGSVKPIPSRSSGKNRIVAPASTILFVPEDFTASAAQDSDAEWISKDSNVPSGQAWNELLMEGSIAVIQLYKSGDGEGAIAQQLSKLKTSSGLVGAVVQGGAKGLDDVGGLSEDGKFVTFVKGGSGIDGKVKPWAVDLTVKIDGREIKGGDIIYADEAEGAIFVLPQENLLTITDGLAQIHHD